MYKKPFKKKPFNNPDSSGEAAAPAEREDSKIHSFLARCGIASRRAAEEMIEQGRVKLNGEVITDKAQRMVPGKDQIEVDGKAVEFKEEPKRYFILNKPEGVMTTLSDPHAEKTVKDFFQDIPERLYPAGRLDMDSTGLILMTNDGDLAHVLTHPRFEVDKKYRVTVPASFTEEARDRLMDGVIIDDEKRAPKTLELVEQDERHQVYIVTLNEGRKREIRRMFEKVGSVVRALRRESFGPLQLGDLPEGEKRELTTEEVEQLKKLAANRQLQNEQRQEGGRERGSDRGGYRGQGPARGGQGRGDYGRDRGGRGGYGGDRNRGGQGGYRGGERGGRGGFGGRDRGGRPEGRRDFGAPRPADAANPAAEPGNQDDSFGNREQQPRSNDFRSRREGSGRSFDRGASRGPSRGPSRFGPARGGQGRGGYSSDRGDRGSSRGGFGGGQGGAGRPGEGGGYRGRREGGSSDYRPRSSEGSGRSFDRGASRGPSRGPSRFGPARGGQGREGYSSDRGRNGPSDRGPSRGGFGGQGGGSREGGGYRGSREGSGNSFRGGERSGGSDYRPRREGSGGSFDRGASRGPSRGPSRFGPARGGQGREGYSSDRGRSGSSDRGPSRGGFGGQGGAGRSREGGGGYRGRREGGGDSRGPKPEGETRYRDSNDREFKDPFRASGGFFRPSKEKFSEPRKDDSAPAPFWKNITKKKRPKDDNTD